MSGITTATPITQRLRQSQPSPVKINNEHTVTICEYLLPECTTDFYTIRDNYTSKI